MRGRRAGSSLNACGRCESVLIPVADRPASSGSPRNRKNVSLRSVQITVFALLNLCSFQNVCLLYLSGMHWPEFQTISLGFTRQSRFEDFLELSVWGIRGVEVGLGLHTDWVRDKKQGGDSPEPRVAVPSFSFFFFFFISSEWTARSCARGGETAAWQMCVGVISSALFSGGLVCDQ